MSGSSMAAQAASESKSGLAEGHTTQTKESSSEHLARIRENQRRSRARKREYVTDLESKIKGCQEEGLQLNVQIQRVARRVVEENKKLRELLANMGVDEWTVEEYLQNNSGTDFQSWRSQRHQEEAILKAQHPCRTCGTAPAKAKEGSQRAQGNSSVFVAPPTHALPTVIPAARQISVSMGSLAPKAPQLVTVPIPQANPASVPLTGEYQFAVNLQHNEQLAGTAPIMNMPVVQPQTTDQIGILPVDFTAYFQSVDIDSVPIPQDFYPSPASTKQCGANLSSESSGSCCASSASSASSPESVTNDACASRQK
ncbi:uncharacterized protein V2V93DRAFT_236489 [Kockiozyma suomiensis]|uniref:uncharacterized protein n=1 Tax=Kockiozyma suomiensis TaxID=1337062 RepID=UPI003343EC30